MKNDGKEEGVSDCDVLWFDSRRVLRGNVKIRTSLVVTEIPAAAKKKFESKPFQSSFNVTVEAHLVYSILHVFNKQFIKFFERHNKI